MADTEQELLAKISRLNSLINNHKQHQGQHESITTTPTIQPIKPIFNKLPPKHIIPQQQPQQYKPPPSQFNKPIFNNKTTYNKPTSINKSVTYNNVNKIIPTTISPKFVNNNIPKTSTTNVNNNNSNVIFSGYSPKITPIVNNKIIPKPTNNNSNVIFSGYKPPPNNTITKTNTFKPTTSRLFIRAPSTSPFMFPKKPLSLSKINRQQLLNNRLLALKKIKQQKLSMATSTPKVIDSIFVKKGNSLVRKELDDKYITIGNKLIRTPTTLSPSTTSPTVITPTLIKPPHKPVNTFRKSIIRTNSNSRMKISDKIKEAIIKKKSGNTGLYGGDSKKKKKKVQYCLFFNRFGKCNNGDKCKYEHDLKRVRICPKFIAGNCEDPDCKLQHSTADLEQMPICHLFLNRKCTNDKCPYLHINLSKDTKVCPDFIDGYCPKGSKCELKHTYIQKKTTKENPTQDNNINNNDSSTAATTTIFQDSFFDDVNNKFYELDNVSNENSSNNNENNQDLYDNDDNSNTYDDIHSFMPIINK